MVKRNLFGVMGALSLMTTGAFVCFPVFAEGSVNIEIIEVVDDGSGGYKPWEDITGAMPGESYSAIPRVLNNGEESVNVRMCLSESATGAGGETINLPANTFGISVNEHWILDNSDSVNSSDPAAGNCYKYNTELGVGAMTEPIFNEVTLSSALGNQYQGATFNLHLVADAVGKESPEPTPEPTSVPDNPNTGDNNAIQNFVINSGLMFLTAGILALTVVGLRKIARK